MRQTYSTVPLLNDTAMEDIQPVVLKKIGFDYKKESYEYAAFEKFLAVKFPLQV